MLISNGAVGYMYVAAINIIRCLRSRVKFLPSCSEESQRNHQLPAINGHASIKFRPTEEKKKQVDQHHSLFSVFYSPQYKAIQGIW